MKTEHIAAQTSHARRGALKNAFRYGVDYVLIAPESATPALLSRNRFNLWSVRDHHHGGERGAGQGADWFRQVLADQGFPFRDAEICLLTQPGFLWFQFNPVSFWIALVDGQPRAFVAEVNNTFGHRHCYFCARPVFAPIRYDTPVHAEKLMHVSPFQRVAGAYTFNFAMDAGQINIRISYENGDQGVIATLSGDRRVASNLSLIRAGLRRPFGGLRVMALIYWQALKLWRKKAPFRRKPPPPDHLVSGGRG